ncbi:hypothetical protein [Selenomonas sp. F0473]|uniref:hypothetical protein n=1 Tax=Selenomonas sp. F0473 TaxID=999423 RepID=UPI00029E599B|nr:hypothetical protein [Selenomonas sp. F0473]EKU72125.1 hypothetical protein HMPREF9161_00810 [Selenomonas sp. F0473]
MEKGYVSLLFSEIGFLKGMASVFDMGSTLNTYNESSTPEEADRNALAHDWRVVGNDLRNAMSVEYGQ